MYCLLYVHVYLHFLQAERVIGQVSESAREVAQVDVLIAAAQQDVSHEEEEELRARCLGCHLVLALRGTRTRF